jgi:hypothetical protein
MKRWGLSLFTLAFVTLLAVPAPIAGQGGRGCRPDRDHDRTAPPRPFKAVLTGATHWEAPGTSQSSCTIVTTVTQSTGQATHLGRISAYWTHCPAEPDNVLDGWVTITAANGDTLLGRYDNDPANPFAAFPISWAGGTGRFADASGAAVATFTVTPQFIPGCVPEPDPSACYDYAVAWPWSATLKGTISY